MLLFVDDKQIRGDLIKSAVMRSDMSPIPLTLEAEIVSDDDMGKRLAENRLITAGSNAFRIVKSAPVKHRIAQGERMIEVVRITALLDSCYPVASVCRKAIIKENTSLAAIYSAAGAKIKEVKSDFSVPRFYCLVGDSPSFHVARVLQEEGGAMRWKGNRLNFSRLDDFFKKPPIINLPENASDNIESDFLNQHEASSFFSLTQDGDFILGNKSAPRSIQYSPFKNARQLRDMSRCLMQCKTLKIYFSAQILAGDLVNFVGGEKLVVITAAHVYESGTDGNGSNQYTRLWLGKLQTS